MTFSQQWERAYKSQQQLSIWPWSDLVSYVYRYKNRYGNTPKVLELGCGAGANVPLFQALEVDYFGIDGSESIISALIERFSNIGDNFKCCDFTRHIPFDIDFDIVVDRAAVTHNDTESINRCISLVKNKMRPGSIYIGVDWFSTEHTSFNQDAEKIDAHTVKNLMSGPLQNLGKVHFSDEQHLRTLFSGFNFMEMDKKTIMNVQDDRFIQGMWNFVAELGVNDGRK